MKITKIYYGFSLVLALFWWIVIPLVLFDINPELPILFFIGLPIVSINGIIAADFFWKDKEFPIGNMQHLRIIALATTLLILIAFWFIDLL